MRVNGYTLIELMVVVVVMLVLAGGSLSAFLTFNRSQSIINDSRNLITEINKVRANAANLYYPENCSALRGVNVKSAEVDGELKGISVTTLCDPANIDGGITEVLMASTMTAPFDVTFTPGTGYTAAGANYSIVITLDTDPTVTKTIVIRDLGLVEAL